MKCVREIKLPLPSQIAKSVKDLLSIPSRELDPLEKVRLDTSSTMVNQFLTNTIVSFELPNGLFVCAGEMIHQVKMPH